MLKKILFTLMISCSAIYAETVDLKFSPRENTKYIQTSNANINVDLNVPENLVKMFTGGEENVDPMFHKFMANNKSNGLYHAHAKIEAGDTRIFTKIGENQLQCDFDQFLFKINENILDQTIIGKINGDNTFSITGSILGDQSFEIPESEKLNTIEFSDRGTAKVARNKNDEELSNQFVNSFKKYQIPSSLTSFIIFPEGEFEIGKTVQTKFVDEPVEFPFGNEVIKLDLHEELTVTKRENGVIYATMTVPLAYEGDTVKLSGFLIRTDAKIDEKTGIVISSDSVTDITIQTEMFPGMGAIQLHVTMDNKLETKTESL